MGKKVSIRKIIIILATIHFLFYSVIFALIVIMQLQRDKIHKNIYDSLLKYERSYSVAYYGYKNIYYHDKLLRFDSYVLYINDDTILWQDTSGRKTKTWVEYKNERIFVDVDLTDYSEYFISDFNIYLIKYNNDSFGRYNFKTKELSQISKKEYYEAKNGIKYSIDMKKTGFNISSDYLDSDISISNKDIIDFLNEKSIAGATKFQSSNYQVSDDILHIRLYYDYYEIILSYDIVSRKIEMADWFRYENDERCSYFYFFKNEYPVSLERYFMVSAYE